MFNQHFPFSHSTLYCLSITILTKKKLYTITFTRLTFWKLDLFVITKIFSSAHSGPDKCILKWSLATGSYARNWKYAYRQVLTNTWRILQQYDFIYFIYECVLRGLELKRVFVVEISISADGGPRSRVSARQTLSSAPHRHQWKYFWAFPGRKKKEKYAVNSGHLVL